MKIYIVKAHNFQSDFVFEQLYFSSLHKAKKSMENLVDYLKYNHDLTSGFVRNNHVTLCNGADEVYRVEIKEELITKKTD